eukprot:CAMPEP_0198253636 /NCGR_PEP_ID=MMETSP1447-20131203/4041_1 /TAXON_ID=420782 /ORGANISM="Chaetoceros dichaeta, Strain CCMP1751" /LENGTH=200 /DNA_ID=CAMNT_0043939391 /DNA_START=72 /DNA_END=674 /DNA_ORIENTATION=+
MTTGGNSVNEEPYVCEAWDKVLPKRIASSSRSMVKKDVDFVTVTESVSVEERLRRKFEDAKKNGSIILLSHDDDDDDGDQEEQVVEERQMLTPTQDYNRKLGSNNNNPDSPNGTPSQLKIESMDSTVQPIINPISPTTPVNANTKGMHAAATPIPTSDLSNKRKKFFLNSNTNTNRTANLESYFRSCNSLLKHRKTKPAN